MLKRTDKWIELYNLGISGKNTDNLLERFEIESNARNCNIAIIALGINDASLDEDTLKLSVSLDRFEDNFKKIYDFSKK